MTPRCLLLLATALATLLPACDTCDDLRADANHLADRAATCEPGDTCVVNAPASNRLGRLACPYPVNAASASQTADEVAQLASDAERCDDCGQPFCAGSATTVSDAATKRCVFAP